MKLYDRPFPFPFPWPQRPSDAAMGSAVHGAREKLRRRTAGRHASA